MEVINKQTIEQAFFVNLSEFTIDELLETNGGCGIKCYNMPCVPNPPPCCLGTCYQNYTPAPKPQPKPGC